MSDPVKSRRRSGKGHLVSSPTIANLITSFANVADDDESDDQSNRNASDSKSDSDVGGLDDIIEDSTNKPGLRRRWLVRSQKVAPDEDGKARLGGLVLVAAEHHARFKRGETIGWEHVDAICTTQRTPDESSESVQSRGLSLVRTLFLAQPTRRFVLGHATVGDMMNMYYADRHGVMNSGRFNIHQNPTKLLKIVVGSALLDDDRLGYGGEVLEHLEAAGAL